MVPAALLLIGLLAYPLVLGTWLGFTDAKVGRPGVWIGFENFTYLITDRVFLLSVDQAVQVTSNSESVSHFLRVVPRCIRART